MEEIQDHLEIREEILFQAQEDVILAIEANLLEDLGAGNIQMTEEIETVETDVKKSIVGMIEEILQDHIREEDLRNIMKDLQVTVDREVRNKEVDSEQTVEIGRDLEIEEEICWRGVYVAEEDMMASFAKFILSMTDQHVIYVTGSTQQSSIKEEASLGKIWKKSLSLNIKICKVIRRI